MEKPKLSNMTYTDLLQKDVGDTIYMITWMFSELETYQISEITEDKVRLESLDYPGHNFITPNRVPFYYDSEDTALADKKEMEDIQVAAQAEELENIHDIFNFLLAVTSNSAERAFCTRVIQEHYPDFTPVNEE